MKIILMAAIYILFLLPVAFFPFHKFPYSLATPLLGSSLLLADIVAKQKKKTIIMICLTYFIFSLTAYKFNLSNHWNIKRADISKSVFGYFKKNYPQKPKATNIYFRNTCQPVCLYIPPNKPHFSKEVSYAINYEDGLRILYNNPKLKIYFEDIDKFKHFNHRSLIIDSRKFVLR